MFAFSKYFKVLFLFGDFMRTLIKITAVIFYFSLCICAQQLSRPQKIEELRRLKTKIEQAQNQIDQMQEQHQKIREALFFINEKDAEEAKRIGAQAHRLFPDGILDDLVDYPEGDSASNYFFGEIGGEYNCPAIWFKNGTLDFGDAFANRTGFIANLGGTLLETISEKNPEFLALAKYQPPPDIKNIKSEYESDGLTFKNKAVVTVGNTYLIRAISLGKGDGIFAIKVHRKDSDGSIIIFVKTIKILESKNTREIVSTNEKPSLEIDYETVQNVQNAMLQKGFDDVTVDGSTVPMTLRGTVPKGKLSQVIQLAQENNGGKPVRNELTEK